MPVETLAATAGSISLAVAIIVQLVKQGLIDPRTSDSPARDALLRGLSYALNLLLLLGFLALNHALDGSMALTYVLLALGQFGVSHAAYSVLSNGAAPRGSVSNAGQPNDVKVLPDDTDVTEASPAAPVPSN